MPAGIPKPLSLRINEQIFCGIFDSKNYLSTNHGDT
jgi:hypothetical protein